MYFCGNCGECVFDKCSRAVRVMCKNLLQIIRKWWKIIKWDNHRFFMENCVELLKEEGGEV